MSETGLSDEQVCGKKSDHFGLSCTMKPDHGGNCYDESASVGKNCNAGTWNPVAPKPQEERSETESDWKPMIEAIEGDGFFVVRHISSGIVANKINEYAALDALLNMLRRVEEFKQKHVVRSAALHESTPKRNDDDNR